MGTPCTAPISVTNCDEIRIITRNISLIHVFGSLILVSTSVSFSAEYSVSEDVLVLLKFDFDIGEDMRVASIFNA